MISSSGLEPFSALTRATAAKTSSAATWAKMSAFWSLAEMSVPRTQIHVISKMSRIASGIRIQALSAAPSAPTISSEKLTPTSANDPITSTPVIVIAHPPIHPSHGPIARVTQLKVVPQSWSTRLR